MEIYYRLNGDQFGPIDIGEFDRLVKESIIDKETYIWHEGLTDWINSGSDELLSSTFKKVPPPFKFSQNKSKNDGYEFAIKPSFEYARDFYSGLATVRPLNGKNAYINMQGRIVHEFENDCYGSDFFESFGFYLEDKAGFIGSDCTIIKIYDKTFKNIGNFKYNGGVYIPTGFGDDTHLYNIDDCSIISGGYLLIRNYTGENYIDRRHFFIDLFGKKTFTEYEPMSRFSEGYSLVMKKGVFSNKIGLLSAYTGKLCVEFDSKYYNNLYTKLSDGIIGLYANPVYDFFDNNGNLLFSKEAYAIGSFKSGLCAYKKEKDGLIGFLNNKGKIVIQPKYKEVGAFNGGLCPIKDLKTGKWGYIDKYDNTIIDYIFDFAGSFNNGLAKVSLDDKLFGYIKNPTDNNINSKLPQHITELINKGQKLAAIKEYSILNNVGLKEAKDFIDNLS